MALYSTRGSPIWRASRRAHRNLTHCSSRREDAAGSRRRSCPQRIGNRRPHARRRTRMTSWHSHQRADTAAAAGGLAPQALRIVRAAHLGMCFGVRDAIALALEHADAGPLTILGDLVHNPTVLSALEAKGIAVAQDVAQVTTPTLMVTAHGASERTLARTRALGLTVVRS